MGESSTTCYTALETVFGTTANRHAIGSRYVAGAARPSPALARKCATADLRAGTPFSAFSVEKGSSYVDLEMFEKDVRENQEQAERPHIKLATAARIVAELRFNVLLGIALHAMVVTTRKVTNTNYCASVQPGQCLDDCLAQIQHRPAPAWDDDPPLISMIWALVAINLLAFAWVCVRAARTPAWCASDLALCFHLNEDYSLRPVFALRLLNATVTLAATALLVAVAYKSDSLQSALMAGTVPFILATIAVCNLHAPSAAFNMPFAACDAQAGCAPFRWAELAQPAPRLLEARVSAAAVEALKAEARKAEPEATPSRTSRSRRESREDCL